MYQSVTIAGRVGASPELRYSPNGVAVTNMSVVTSEKYKKDDGSLVESKAWWRVVVWGKQAESCSQYLDKGSLVLIEGKIITDDSGNVEAYMRKDGTPAASLKLKANSVKFLSSKNNGEQAQSGVVTNIDDTSPIDEDSLPF